MTRAHYSAELLEPSPRHPNVKAALIVRDLNDGAVSVTNDVEAVVSKLFESFPVLDMRILYLDADGFWDEIVTRKGRFVCFSPIRRRDLGEALAVMYAMAAPESPFDDRRYDGEVDKIVHALELALAPFRTKCEAEGWQALSLLVAATGRLMVREQVRQFYRLRRQLPTALHMLTMLAEQVRGPLAAELSRELARLNTPEGAR